MRGLELSLVVLLAGCVDDWCDRFSLACEVSDLDEREIIDQDGDVWVAASDCDDQDPLIHPNAEEICDGVDNNCDGQVDEGTPGLQDFYVDMDGDGYGNPIRHVIRCEEPEGWVGNDLDCDDSDPEINPDATEVCDDAFVDEDCDGLRDDDDPSVDRVDPQDFWTDADGDGYGDPDAYAGLFCHEVQTGPPIRVSNDLDCDDTDADVNPGAVEVWYDGADADCDGGDDFDADGDGQAIEAVGGLDCDDGDDGIYAGAEEVCDGQDHDCDGRVCMSGDLSVAHALIEGTAFGEGVGSSSAVADLDGDGDPELVLGAGTGFATVLYVLPASVSGTVSASAGLTIAGRGGSGWFGGSLNAEADGMGDDGYADVLTGDIQNSEEGRDAGGVFVFAGPITSSIPAGQESLLLTGQGSDAFLGSQVSWVDGLTGSGVVDLVATSQLASEGGANAGAVYVWAGPISGDTDETDPIALLGEASTDNAGSSLAHGDLDADGVADLVVGAYASNHGSSNAGAAYVVLGPVTQDAVLSSAWMRVYGTTSGGNAGKTVAVGDLDDDGQDDLVIGAVYGGSSNQGEVAVFTQLSAGDRFTDDAALLIEGESYHDALGSSLATDADVDGDGRVDLLIGARLIGTGHDGAVYVYTGPWVGRSSVAAGATQRVDGLSGDAAGRGISGVPDLDGDGWDEFLVGACDHDGATVNTGAFYLVYGSAL